MALGPHVREFRARAGLSQGALAERVKIDVTYLSKIEHGRRPSDRVLHSLAEALGVEPATLLAGEERSSGSAPLTPPRYRTEFVDRDDDRGRLRRLLERAGSLITVTGPPGCGKTRLAAEVAAELASEGRPISWTMVGEDGHDHTPAALTHAPSGPMDILVLDDADRDVDGSTASARRLITGGATVVATSRQPLGVYGEQLLRLTSLPVPDRHQRPSRGDGPGPDLGRLQEQESVRLFVDRASLVTPEFRLDPTNAPAVFDVCRWLDGLPLAIELAAQRLRQMAIADLAANLGHLLDWLEGNTSDVPERHSSLRAAIGWSFDRLSARQRTVAIRLSMFESTFGLADAATVAADGDHPDEFVQATVMDLVDRSLLVWRENADGRAVYRWLRPVRQYARQQLDREADREQTMERHRSWLRDFVVSLQRNGLPRLGSEWERLAELSPELVSTVYRLPTDERAQTMTQLADALSISLQFGNLAQHVNWYGSRLHDWGPDVLREAGSLARVRGDFDEAYRNFESAYNIAENDRDALGMANSSLDLAENAHDRGQYPAASEHVDRASQLYEQLGNDRGQIEVLNLRGKLAMENGRLGDAERLFSEALDQAERVGDTRLFAYSLYNLGVGDYLLRRIASARNRLSESLTLREGMRNQRGVARIVEAFALIESQVQNHELALELLGAARQYRSSSGAMGIPDWWREKLNEVEQEARVALASTPEAADHHLHLGAASKLADAGEQATLAISSAVAGALPGPASAPLRRRIPSPHVDRELRADDLAGAARDQEPAALDLALRELVVSGGASSEARRSLSRAMVLALAEPIDAPLTDLLCFATDHRRYRGMVVPLFTSQRALAVALERCPAWGSHPVVEVRLDLLRASLAGGETAVVNAWTDHEYRVSSSEEAYYSASPALTTSTEAPTSRSLSSSRS